MIEIKVDRTICQGYGNCVLAMGDVFDIDNDGIAVVLKGQVGDDRLAEVKRAVYNCPSEAISFTQSASEQTG